MNRRAFSLLEIIIATAILAASAMVLTSLIGLGTKYGNRAEERTIAISQAESLLDEFLAQLGVQGKPLQATGELPGAPSRGYRITAVPFEVGQTSTVRGGGERFDRPSGGLLRVTVEIFESSNTTGSDSSQPLVTLNRLVRQPFAIPDPESIGLTP